MAAAVCAAANSQFSQPEAVVLYYISHSGKSKLEILEVQ